MLAEIGSWQPQLECLSSSDIIILSFLLTPANSPTLLKKLEWFLYVCGRGILLPVPASHYLRLLESFAFSADSEVWWELIYSIVCLAIVEFVCSVLCSGRANKSICMNVDALFGSWLNSFSAVRGGA